MPLTTQQYQQIFHDNIAIFQHGTTFTRDQLNTLCGTPDIEPYTDVRGAVHYLNLNKVIRPFGLYIKARNYYSSFEILPLERTSSRVISYSGESRAKQRRGEQLSHGAIQYANWNTLTPNQRRAALNSNWRNQV